METKGFIGKNILITGASKGLGRMCANSFEKNGFVVLENVLNFDETEIIEIERYKNKYTNENFGKDGIVLIRLWSK